MKPMSCFIIAEAGVNHNGSEALAMALVEAAAKAGADAVKFQTFNADKLVRPGAAKAEYQERETGSGDQYGMLRALELPADAYPRLLGRCNELGIEFMSTPFDEEAADFLCGLGMRRIKVPSGELTNHPFLRYLAAKGLPIILSTGMSNLNEVVEAINVIEDVWRRDEVEIHPAMLTVLHCTSNYPTGPEDVNLRAMQTLAGACQLPVGYSDHTNGVAVAIAATALGATVLEKHFTLDHELPGPDHKASLEPEMFARMVREIRIVERALGDGVKQPRPAELPVRDLVRRSVTLARPVKSGQALTAADLILLRPGNGIPPRELDRVIGRRAARDIAAGTTLGWGDLQP